MKNELKKRRNPELCKNSPALKVFELGRFASSCELSPSCVRDLMKKHGIPPSPHRKGLSWEQFIQAHLEVIWAADFFTEEVWTCSGLVTYYTLLFIHLGTRRVQFAGCTPQPNACWMQQQARNFSLLIGENARQPSYLIHDRDAAFLPLDQVLRPVGDQGHPDASAITDVQRLRGAVCAGDEGDARPANSAG